jgi:excisionase family DNA binding protein
METLAIRATEAAKRLGIGRSKVYELISAGILPSIRIGKSVRVPVSALEKWLADSTVGGRNE